MEENKDARQPFWIPSLVVNAHNMHNRTPRGHHSLSVAVGTLITDKKATINTLYACPTHLDSDCNT